jgi:arylformamidase
VDRSLEGGGWIDATVALSEALPVWPGSAGIRVHQQMRLERGDPSNVTRLDFDIHVGTHVEMPLHFIDGGASVDELRLEDLIGEVTVVDLPSVAAVSAEDLEGAAIPAGARRLLIRTSNGPRWERREFDPRYVSLTLSAAQWIAGRGIRAVGIDYLSIQRYGDAWDTHRVLMQANVTIIEGLNLSNVAAGQYEMICLPLRLAGAEAAPARVLVRRIEEQ